MTSSFCFPESISINDNLPTLLKTTYTKNQTTTQPLKTNTTNYHKKLPISSGTCTPLQKPNFSSSHEQLIRESASLFSSPVIFFYRRDSNNFSSSHRDGPRRDLAARFQAAFSLVAPEANPKRVVCVCVYFNLLFVCVCSRGDKTPTVVIITVYGFIIGFCEFVLFWFGCFFWWFNCWWLEFH